MNARVERRRIASLSKRENPGLVILRPFTKAVKGGPCAPRAVLRRTECTAHPVWPSAIRVMNIRDVIGSAAKSPHLQESPTDGFFAALRMTNRLRWSPTALTYFTRSLLVCAVLLGSAVHAQAPNTPASAVNWVLPIFTVSQSEGGFEKVYQGSCLLPHWPVRNGELEASVRLQFGPIAGSSGA